MNNYASKVRLLRLWEILVRETSEARPMRTNDIIDALAEYGLMCDRRTLYGDIKQLNENGYRVAKKLVDHSNEYYAVGRLNKADIGDLVDMVYESALPAEAKEALIKRLFVSVAYQT